MTSKTLLSSLLKLVKKHWIFLIILIVGVFLRSYLSSQLFMYSHDQDLSGWFVRDVLENKHLRLIGQETSSKGVFIGPLYYYLLIPFYLLFKMDPIGGVYLSIIVGAISIFSFYFVFSKVFEKKVGILASLFYSLSFYTVMTDREVVPTIFVMLWSVWFFYCLYIFLKAEKGAFLLFGLLLGLVWNINLALLIVSPLAVLAVILSKKKTNIRYLLLGVVLFFIVSLPFTVFEAKHGFTQTKSIYYSLTTQKDYTGGDITFSHKLDRVMQLVKRNTMRLLWGDDLKSSDNLSIYLFVGLFVYLVVKRKLPLKLAAIAVLWQLIYIAFFTENPINVSEYYLNGMNVIWILIFSLFIRSLFKGKASLFFAVIIVAAFAFININRLLNIPINKSGYIERKALVSAIKKDADVHGYSCVAVSYITKPGLDMGYRYLFFLEGLHVNQPKSMSPVYTIVFPLSMVDRVDRTFGALGLVLPDYERYNEVGVEESCAGLDSNFTDPLFGFTK